MLKGRGQSTAQRHYYKSIYVILTARLSSNPLRLMVCSDRDGRFRLDSLIRLTTRRVGAFVTTGVDG